MMQYAYARYSVAGYGTNTPNYWKVWHQTRSIGDTSSVRVQIQQYGGGNIDNCVDSNEFCYVCEPPAEEATDADFGIFPEPANSTTWQAAVKYVTATAGGSNPPVWDPEMVPNRTWTDPKTGMSVLIPGSDQWAVQNRDPYADLVSLAKDLGMTGVDIGE
jgi:hypothetical protein